MDLEKNGTRDEVDLVTIGRHARPTFKWVWKILEESYNKKLKRYLHTRRHHTPCHTQVFLQPQLSPFRSKLVATWRVVTGQRTVK